jgi:hypothetical protein
MHRTDPLLHSDSDGRRPTSASIMATLGLPDFETPSACEKRQRALRAALGDSPEGQIIARDLADCARDGCRRDACDDACYFAAARRRSRLIRHAHGLLVQHNGPLLLATIEHPNWEAPVGGLAGTGTQGPREWIKRRLESLFNAADVIAVGQFERALNVKLDGSSSWSGEVHVVVAGASKEQLRDAFGIARRYHRDPQEKLHHVKAVHGLGRALGHALTYFLARRVAYITNTGRQGRRSMPLQREQLAELGAWHASLKSGERVVLFGCRRHGGGLVTTTRRHCARDAYAIMEFARALDSEIESVRAAILDE